MEEVERVAAARGVPFDDFNQCYEEIGLTQADFYDQRHLNGGGAVKFTDYFARLMKNRRYPRCCANRRTRHRRQTMRPMPPPWRREHNHRRIWIKGRERVPEDCRDPLVLLGWRLSGQPGPGSCR